MLDDDGGTVYSRAGAFGVDRSGFVTNSANQKLMAFQVDSAGLPAGTPVTAADRYLRRGAECEQFGHGGT